MLNVSQDLRVANIKVMTTRRGNRKRLVFILHILINVNCFVMTDFILLLLFYDYLSEFFNNI